MDGLDFSALSQDDMVTQAAMRQRGGQGLGQAARICTIQRTSHGARHVLSQIPVRPQGR
jgi:hypothetical protein